MGGRPKHIYIHTILYHILYSVYQHRHPVKGGAQIALTPSCRRLGCISGPKHFLPPSWSSREHGWNIPTTRLGQTYVYIYRQGPGDFFLNFVCVLHFCVDDLLLLIQHAAICVSEKPKGWNQGRGFSVFWATPIRPFRLLEISNAIWWYPLTVIPPQSNSEKSPLKIYMEPKTGGLEDDFPIQLGDF